MLGGVCVVLLVWLMVPKPELNQGVSYGQAIVDRQGRLLRLTLAADDRYRIHQPLASISADVVAATLLYEDRYFYQHPGVNPIALLRAAWTTYIAGARAVGASTITMQLVRLRFQIDSRTPLGKLSQIFRALQVERHYSKSDILAAYLNRAPYGGNIEGLGAASLIYFDKTPDTLNLPEALTLAVIAQNPVRRDPSTKAGYEQMAKARARLAQSWAATYGMNPTTTAQIELPLQVGSRRELPFSAPHFVQALAGTMAVNSDITEPMLSTTLDLPLQRVLEQQVTQHVANQQHLGIHNASALLVDWRSMEVLATVGSADYFDRYIAGQVDGTRAKRSPGSTLKPLIYAMALDEGLIHPRSLLRDAPLRFAAYTPENFDRGFMGPISAQDALIYSRNVPAIDLLNRVGYQRFHNRLVSSGVDRLKAADHYGLSMILGGNELTMQELAVLYAALANRGEVRPLRSILPSRGNQKPSAAAITQGSRARIASPEASYVVLDMLRNNPRPGELAIAGRPRLPVAWKTGTSYAHRDAWTIGVAGPYVLATWVGNFDGTGNPALVGRKMAAPLFFSILDAVLPQVATSTTIEPGPSLNLRQVSVCAPSGALPTRHCPQVSKTWFIPGVSPIAVDSVFRSVPVHTATGKRSCGEDEQHTREEVFQFWPSDMYAQLRRAGIGVRPPPAWADNCKLMTRQSNGSEPLIRSPSAGVSYQTHAEKGAHEAIALQAVAEADVEWLYWFVDQQFIGRAPPDKPLFWQPTLGEHEVSAIDDAGRAHTQRFRVAFAN